MNVADNKCVNNYELQELHKLIRHRSQKFILEGTISV